MKLIVKYIDKETRSIREEEFEVQFEDTKYSTQKMDACESIAVSHCKSNEDIVSWRLAK